jgi:PAS domain S-box-containing protein
MTKASILVVEDESIVAKDIKNRLNKFGYTVAAVASSGEEAMHKAAETRPNLVLMDIRLKGTIDGVEAARQIYNLFNIPVIYLTAYADDSTLERVKETQAFGYLIKPFKERELYTAIELALRKHRMERELKDNEKWLTAMLNSMGDGVIASNNKELVTFINPVAEALTGWTQEEAIGRNSTQVFNIANAENYTRVDSPVNKALQEGVIVGIPENTILITKSGLEIPINDSVAPIKDDKDNIVGAILVFRETSDRQQSQEANQSQIQHQEMVAELEEINRLKDEFINTISHELRSPMANIKMAIQLLELAPTPQQRERYLQILRYECDRELELINTLLDLQRAEASSCQNLTIEAMPLQYWLPTLVEPFQVRANERQQALKVNVPSDLTPLMSDSASLERILAELFNNACKYTVAGGEIHVSVYQNSSASPSETIFIIKNQAQIPAEDLPRIFDKFYRVHSAHPSKQGGSGLGLALVQKLVEQLQGTIQVESSDGWTKFTLIFKDLTSLTG